MEHVCIVILAAGNSKRLGSPKQLLVYKGKSLLQRATEAAVGTGISPVLIITGSNSKLMEKELENYQVQLIHNAQWEEGMSSSIRSGVNAALKINPETDGILFMVCDQPFTDTNLLKDLISKQQSSGKPITASVYDNVIGIPAIYHKSIFPNLMTLKGDIGAKKIIANHMDSLATVPFYSGKTDIDTKSDYEELLKTLQ